MNCLARHWRWSLPAALLLLSGATVSQSTPSAFTAAVIKLDDSGSDARHAGSDDGRLVIENQSLKTILRIAYGLKPQQIVGPDWITTQAYDVTGTTDAKLTWEQMVPLLRPLLTERLHMKTHHETRPMAVFALTVAKSGLKAKATTHERNELANRTEEGIHLTGTISAADLAENLSAFTDRPILDHTGLQGNYTFDLWWSPDSVATDSSVPAHPALVTAVEEQLGLKLESHTEPADVLVIDAVQRIPDNN